MMKAIRYSSVIVLLLFMISVTSALSFGKGVDEPLPNVTQIEVYDVSGLSVSEKETEGSLVDSGLKNYFDS